MNDIIYLDNQATTPLAPEVYEIMMPWLRDHFGNPHSAHMMGRQANAAVEVAREQVAALMPAGDVLFTSGATEAINQAITGALHYIEKGRDKIIILPSEHTAVLDVARYVAKHGVIDQNNEHRHFELIFAPMQSDGVIDIERFKALMDDRIAIVAAMLVNNEIGTIQPIKDIADIAHKNGALILCDMVQGFGRVPIPANIDLAAISSHKIYGPKGIGALWVRDGVKIGSIIRGGGQEKGLRSGTISPALCAGFGKAASLMHKYYNNDNHHIEKVWDAVMPYIMDWKINGTIEKRYKGNLNIYMAGLDIIRLMSDLRHIAFSAGSACASGSGKVSHVLNTIGLGCIEARSSIRLGFGRYTSLESAVLAIKTIDIAAKEQMSEALV